MGCLTKQDLLAPKGLKCERFDLAPDSWVMVRELDAVELVAMQERFKQNPDDRIAFLYDVLAASLVDDKGERLYQDAADAKTNLHISMAAAGQICDKAVALNGFVKPKEPDGKN